MNTTLYTPLFEKQNTTYLGVAHGGDVPFVFDTVASYNTSTLAQRQLASSMAASWSAFASYGDVEKGTLALKGWEGAIGDEGFQTRILGGPNNGMAAIDGAGRDGVLRDEDLIRRCKFWNDEGVLGQLQK